ncbi:hypothetical protein [Paracoccus fontiphilus]|uniref:hypothetical protein n=1 Tax=Paracoccus fontiphilus TaxID=1815556 RepID=UPI001A96C7A6|nr:hypothetical protein [Paracoccus fontiphilus]
MRSSLAASLALVAVQAHAQDCQPIRFAPGDNGALIEGVLPPKDPFVAVEPSCFSLDVRAGQRVIVAVEGDDNAVATISGAGDARQAFDFLAPSNFLEILLFQLFPSPSEAPYALTVQVD